MRLKNSESGYYPRWGWQFYWVWVCCFSDGLNWICTSGELRDYSSSALENGYAVSGMFSFAPSATPQIKSDIPYRSRLRLNCVVLPDVAGCSLYIFSNLWFFYLFHIFISKRQLWKHFGNISISYIYKRRLN